MKRDAPGNVDVGHLLGRAFGWTDATEHHTFVDLMVIVVSLSSEEDALHEHNLTFPQIVFEGLQCIQSLRLITIPG